MHSDLEQTKREDVMLDFKAGKVKVIVATDIISRGLDVENIETVINFDVPNEAEEYVHRIGRTARADKEGIGISLINSKDIRRFKGIEKLLGKEVEKVSLPEGFGPGPEYIVAPKNKKGRSFSYKNKKRKNEDGSSTQTKKRRRREWKRNNVTQAEGRKTSNAD